MNRIAKSTKTVLPLLLVGLLALPQTGGFCSQYLPLMTSFGNRLTLRRRPKGPPARRQAVAERRHEWKVLAAEAAGLGQRQQTNEQKRENGLG